MSGLLRETALRAGVLLLMALVTALFGITAFVIVATTLAVLVPVVALVAAKKISGGDLR